MEGEVRKPVGEVVVPPLRLLTVKWVQLSHGTVERIQ